MDMTNADPDLPVLQSLLDAFPSAPLELIASAFTLANGAPDLAAEAIISNLNGIRISSTPAVPPPKLLENEKVAAPKVAPLYNKHRLPFGRRQPCLQDYIAFPPENAWSRPSNISQECHADIESSTHSGETIDLSLDFPPLGNDNPILSSSRVPRTKMCNSKSVSVSSGLVANVRRDSAELYSTENKKSLTDNEGCNHGDVEKWVMKQLLDKFPTVDTDVLSEILRASNFSYNDAEKIFQEMFLGEYCFVNSKESIKPYELSNMILESLFSCHEEVPLEEKKNKNRDRDFSKRSAITNSAKEVPKWSVVTSSDLDYEERHQPLTSEVPIGGNGTIISQVKSYGDWDDYDRHCSSSKQHWKTMFHYFEAAGTAYKHGDFTRAEELTEKGNCYKKLAMEAKERANKHILHPKYQQTDSSFILDLQDQDISGALKLLKLHLKSLSRIPSCHALNVITGSGKHTSSQCSRLTNEVLKYVEERGYDWIETAPFHYEIQLR